MTQASLVVLGSEGDENSRQHSYGFGPEFCPEVRIGNRLSNKEDFE